MQADAAAGFADPPTTEPHPDIRLRRSGSGRARGGGSAAAAGTARITLRAPRERAGAPREAGRFLGYRHDPLTRGNAGRSGVVSQLGPPDFPARFVTRRPRTEPGQGNGQRLTRSRWKWRRSTTATGAAPMPPAGLRQGSSTASLDAASRRRTPTFAAPHRPTVDTLAGPLYGQLPAQLVRSHARKNGRALSCWATRASGAYPDCSQPRNER